MAIMADVARNPAFARRGAGAPARPGAGRPAGRLPGAGPGRGLRRRAGGVRRHALRPRRRPARRPRSPKLKPADLAALHTGLVPARQRHPGADRRHHRRAGLRAGGAGVRRLGQARRAPAGRRRRSRPQAKPRAIAIDLPGTGQAAVNLAKPGIAAQRPGLLSRHRRQHPAGRRLFLAAEPGDPGQARPLLRRLVQPRGQPHDRLVPRRGPDQERDRAAGAGPDRRADDLAGGRRPPTPTS